MLSKEGYQVTYKDNHNHCFPDELLNKKLHLPLNPADIWIYKKRKIRHRTLAVWLFGLQYFCSVALLTWPAAEGWEGEGDVPLRHPALVHCHTVVVPLVVGVHVRDRQREVSLHSTWKRKKRFKTQHSSDISSESNTNRIPNNANKPKMVITVMKKYYSTHILPWCNFFS